MAGSAVDATVPSDGPAPGAPRPPRTYLAWSVAATCLCFLPLGLVAVVYGLRVGSDLAAGRAEQARRHSRVARRWLVVTILVGLLVYAVIAVAFALLGAFSA